MVPNPAPSRNWGSAPDPAPQTPEGLSIARPASPAKAYARAAGTPVSAVTTGSRACWISPPTERKKGRGAP
ncbi:hypothetical protein GCM10012286_01190 [Streptomyces lasiicapitis]|uniref:Uncharacterized protein n=1 Tax=Streptomyces lasiicapitis TaxID=1923961 RepID=A0ABQ2LHC2_9ACTN|nr:hypothetical protein GCM10012286_01190 [Streptomyces lasiicapitis]